MPLSLRQITGSNFAYQHLPFESFLDDAADLGRERLELSGAASQRADRGRMSSPPSR
jgi:protein FrlC